MPGFTTLTGVAAPLLLDDLDTDKVIPASYMKGLTRAGLGAHLFQAIRYDASAGERPDFVLNRIPFRSAKVLIAGRNFGCGSSREHAVWALTDFGIGCVIGPSFGDIFAGNAVKNGLLLARVDAATCARIANELAASQNAPVTVDLAGQAIVLPTGETIPFAIDPADRAVLSEGLDEIGRTLRFAGAIADFEARSEALA